MFNQLFVKLVEYENNPQPTNSRALAKLKKMCLLQDRDKTIQTIKNAYQYVWEQRSKR